MYESFDSLVSEDTFLKMFSVSDDKSMLDKILNKFSIFLHSLGSKVEKPFKVNDMIEMYRQDALKTISLLDEKFTISHDQFYVLYIWLVLRRIGRSFIEEYGLDDQIIDKINVYTQSDLGSAYTRLIKFLISEQELWKHFETETCYSFIEKLFEIEEVRELLEFNRFDVTLWFKKEAFDEFFILFEVTQTITLMTTSRKMDTQNILVKIHNCFHKIRKAYAFSDFKVYQFLEGLR